jgi:hypothetical protein
MSNKTEEHLLSQVLSELRLLRNDLNRMEWTVQEVKTLLVKSIQRSEQVQNQPPFTQAQQYPDDGTLGHLDKEHQ